MADSAFPMATLEAAANAYAAAHGLQVERLSEEGASVYQSAPISLLPNAYPEAAFEQAIVLSPSFNALVDRLSQDANFLQATLGGSVSSADPFTAQLLDLYQKIYVTEKPSAAVTADRLGILRSDYMLHRNDKTKQYQIKQVELNTIAASFAGLASVTASLHSYVVERYGSLLRPFLQANQEAVTGSKTKLPAGVPSNPALDRLPAAMNVAVERYQERFASKDTKNSCILFVVQPNETNTVDQRKLELALWSQHGIPVVRKSLAQIQNESVLDEESGRLTLQDAETTVEVSVVYFRAGYAPTDYPSGKDGVEWQARERIERSRATKCPSLGYHLAGTKKVQQELARPGVLERFASQDAAAMREAFAGLYSLGEDAIAEDLAVVRDVLAGGEDGYVLKPQREGGGYNFYGQKLAKKLYDNVRKSGDSIELDKKLGEYILMERLFPPQQQAILLRSGRVEGSGDSVSELGCFGAIVTDANGNVVHNEYAGFLLRTKFSNVDEGGVASGFATLSSPYLC